MTNPFMRNKSQALALIAVVISLGGVYAFKPELFGRMALRSTSTNASFLFCSGVDTKTGEFQAVRFVDTMNGTGHLQIFSKQNGPNTANNLRFDDPNGMIHYEGPEKRPSRISLRLSDKENLQVYRECGATPVCRFEHVQHMNADEYKQAQEKIKDMEREAFYARKQTAQIAERYSMLRSKIEASQAQLKSAQQKQSRTPASDAEKSFHKLNEEASEVVGELHSSTVATETLHRQLQAMQESLRSKGTHVELTELVPSQVDEWCTK